MSVPGDVAQFMELMPNTFQGSGFHAHYYQEIRLLVEWGKAYGK